MKAEDIEIINEMHDGFETGKTFLNIEGGEALKKEILDNYEFTRIWKSPKMTEQSYLELKEKADELDKLYDWWKATGYTTDLELEVHKLEQENKQLKEKAEKWDNMITVGGNSMKYIEKLEQENKRLKEKLQKIYDHLLGSPHYCNYDLEDEG